LAAPPSNEKELVEINVGRTLIDTMPMSTIIMMSSTMVKPLAEATIRSLFLGKTPLSLTAVISDEHISL
jgi:hypothetical protein